MGPRLNIEAVEALLSAPDSRRLLSRGLSKCSTRQFASCRDLCNSCLLSSSLQVSCSPPAQCPVGRQQETAEQRAERRRVKKERKEARRARRATGGQSMMSQGSGGRTGATGVTIGDSDEESS